jgi:SET domain-containing protein
MLKSQGAGIASGGGGFAEKLAAWVRHAPALRYHPPPCAGRARVSVATMMSEEALKIEVRRSNIHGLGVYVTAPIKAGETIVEVVGERISSEESDRRYHERDGEPGHTFMFYVDEDTVIDCGVNGNISRFINHSCEPNCEAVDDDGRIFLEALRDIEVGEELVYDYRLTWESTDDPEDLKVYSCRCGTPSCRGTMLDVVPLAEAS